MQFILTMLICVSEKERQRERERERERRERERERERGKEGEAYLVFYKLNHLSWYNVSFGASEELACTFDLFL